MADLNSFKTKGTKIEKSKKKKKQNISPKCFA